MRLTLVSFCSAALALALAQGCLIGPSTLDEEPSGSGSGAGAGTGTGTGSGGGIGGSGPVNVPSDAGIPCDVALLLNQWCTACHSQSPIGGASVPLVTYEDLTAPFPADPSITVAAASLARMKDAAAPMPLGGLLPAADIAPLETWVQAGTPATDCADVVTPTGPDPYAVDPVCTSNTFWNMGEESSPDMLPGRACIACHSMEGGERGPDFQFSGTIYPTAHEPDDCNGAQGAVIEITDANGVVTNLTSRASGNFYKSGNPALVAWPVTVKVLYDGKTLPMATPLMNGDCNSCHTGDGTNGAPGRIILPP